MTVMPGPDIREAVGIFLDAGHLCRARDELLSAGFDRGQLGLLAGSGAVSRLLGALYRQCSEPEEANAGAASMAFVETSSSGETGGFGSLHCYGVDTPAGEAVASAAVLGGAVMGAADGVAGAAASGPLLGLVIHDADAEYLERQIDAGHLLLFVRTLDPERQSHAVEILLRHSTGFPRVYRVADSPPLRRMPRFAARSARGLSYR